MSLHFYTIFDRQGCQLFESCLIHCGILTPHGAIVVDYLWCMQWLVADSSPKPYLPYVESFSIESLGTSIDEMSPRMQYVAVKNIHIKVSSA